MKQLKQIIFALVLCFALVLTGIGVQNIFNNPFNAATGGNGTIENPYWTTGAKVSGCSETPVFVKTSDWGTKSCYFYTMATCGSSTATSNGTIAKIIPKNSDGTISFNVYFRLSSFSILPLTPIHPPSLPPCPASRTIVIPLNFDALDLTIFKYIELIANNKTTITIKVLCFNTKLNIYIVMLMKK